MFGFIYGILEKNIFEKYILDNTLENMWRMKMLESTFNYIYLANIILL